MRLCIIRTPILDCALEKKKKKEGENRGSGYAKLALKNHDFNILKKRQLDHLFRKIVSLDAPAIQETISSSDGFFWRSATVKSWIPSAIHCIELFNYYSRNTMGQKTEVNLRGIRAKLVFSFANTTFTFSVT